ncbi:hypothetical protein CANCADRAFT_130700 [Tortispora caseinolytica NRRL Y-17796]|uniref:Hydroxymethylglutaryl-CoA synthase n=1 Tax=Tortispora caseinolytica NRRL Y-17796 TaxID=767744 RepID=A0A1E4TB06_9ASCO|nr:hypothetical protein CANCADRAFT_130700 [Tortispora caseinolytica NRRL Y-17796]
MSRPQNIGIHAIEVYFPSRYVDQNDLEKFDNIPTGKYTIGLGQKKMAFVDDREDIYSLTLTVVSNLLRNYNIDPNSIGRLEVGTETVIDKAKSVKSVLMQLMGDNTDVEGIDNLNACYGGFAAFLNSVAWIESSAWDGRYALVVSGDIALYAKSAARPTGGAGAVAMLLGPNAPIVLEPIRGSHMEHAYDFYKADLNSEYPIVDGKYSLTCYTKSLDNAYNSFVRKLVKSREQLNGSADPLPELGIDFFDYTIFHAPNCKLVTKCYARLLYNDYLRNPDHPEFSSVPAEYKDLDQEASLADRNVEKTFMALAKERSAKRLTPSLFLPANSGNMYTATVFGALCSLLSQVPADQLLGKRIGGFSYGSGLASTFFSLIVKGDVSEIQKALNLEARLESRKSASPEEYEKAVDYREAVHAAKSYTPSGDIDSLFPNTYYLTAIDDLYRRSYAIKE